MKHLALIAILLLPSAALADATRNIFTGAVRRINAVTLDASSSSFAVNLEEPGKPGIYGLMTVWACTLDADNGLSALNMSCAGSRDGGTTDYTLQAPCDVSSGVCTTVDASWTKNPGANTACWPWPVEVEGVPYIECTFTDTGGDGSDTLTVYTSFAIKG